MSDNIKVVKTKWRKMRKIKKRCKEFNKRYGNKSYTAMEINKILMEWEEKDNEKQV